MRVAAVVVTWNSAAWLPGCLRALAAQTLLTKLEAFLAANN